MLSARRLPGLAPGTFETHAFRTPALQDQQLALRERCTGAQHDGSRHVLAEAIVGRGKDNRFANGGLSRSRLNVILSLLKLLGSMESIQ